MIREIKLPQSETKRRLLDVAEQLFAERGFESVSLRDVTQLAKANTAAINYHFGDREGLIATVITRYITPVNEQRLMRLDLLENTWPGKAAPVEEILDAFIRPLAGMVRKSELSERLFCKLMGRIFAYQGQGLPPLLEMQIKDLSDRFTRALARVLPSLAPEDLAWRTHFVVGAMIHSLLNQEMLHRMTTGASGTPTMDAILARLIRFAAAGLKNGELVEPSPELSPQASFNF